MTGVALHVSGRILVGPEQVRDDLWVVGGRITFDRPAAVREVRTIRGWALPGLVDAHCHVGLDAHGAVDDATSEKQALTERDAGALLLRDAGSPSDTRWVDDREDLPGSSGRAATSPAPAATSATSRTRSSPATWPPTSAPRRAAATAG